MIYFKHSEEYKIIAVFSLLNLEGTKSSSFIYYSLIFIKISQACKTVQDKHFHAPMFSANHSQACMIILAIKFGFDLHVSKYYVILPFLYLSVLGNF